MSDLDPEQTDRAETAEDDANGRSWQDYLRETEGGEPGLDGAGSNGFGGVREDRSELTGTPEPVAADPEPAIAEAEQEPASTAAEPDEHEFEPEEEAPEPEEAAPAPLTLDPEPESVALEPEPEEAEPEAPEPEPQPVAGSASDDWDPDFLGDRPRRRRVLSGAVGAAALLVGLLVVPGLGGSGDGANRAAASTGAGDGGGSAFFAATSEPAAGDDVEGSSSITPSRSSAALAASDADGAAAGGASSAAAEPGDVVPARPGRIEGPAVPEIDEGPDPSEPTVSVALDDDTGRVLPPPPSRSAPSAGPRWIPRDQDPVVANAEEVRRLLLDRYPGQLRDDGVGGSVTLWLFVDETGSVTRVRVQESSSVEALDRAAEEVAREMEFRPARSGDRPIGVWVQQNLSFRAGS